METSYWQDILQSVYNVIDHKLLEQGAYVNISTGEKNARGYDISKLYPVVDNELYSVSGHIWQTPYHNFVYESGVNNVDAPIIISGVTVNGTFIPKGTSGLHIDFDNGRALFDVAISPNSDVKAAFARKEYSFIRPNNDRAYKDLTNFKDNSNVYQAPFPATPYTPYLPAIFMEIEYGDEVPFQLGGTNTTKIAVKLTIVSEQQSQLDAIASTILTMGQKSFPVVSAKLGPVFDFFGDVTQNYNFCTWFSLSRNFGQVRRAKYNKIFDTNGASSDPKLYGGAVTLDIDAIR